MMKHMLFLLLILTLPLQSVIACEVCKQNQPKPLQNITHGAGPQSDWDYVIIMVGIILVSFTLFYSIKYLISPGEKQSDHIKHMVVDERY